MDFTPFIRDIPDFPKPGILFKDITARAGSYSPNSLLNAGSKPVVWGNLGPCDTTPSPL